MSAVRIVAPILAVLRLATGALALTLALKLNKSLISLSLITAFEWIIGIYILICGINQRRNNKVAFFYVFWLLELVSSGLVLWWLDLLILNRTKETNSLESKLQLSLATFFIVSKAILPGFYFIHSDKIYLHGEKDLEANVQSPISTVTDLMYVKKIPFVSENNSTIDNNVFKMKPRSSASPLTSADSSYLSDELPIKNSNNKIYTQNNVQFVSQLLPITPIQNSHAFDRVSVNSEEERIQMLNISQFMQPQASNNDNIINNNNSDDKLLSNTKLNHINLHTWRKNPEKWLANSSGLRNTTDGGNYIDDLKFKESPARGKNIILATVNPDSKKKLALPIEFSEKDHFEDSGISPSSCDLYEALNDEIKKNVTVKHQHSVPNLRNEIVVDNKIRHSWSHSHLNLNMPVKSQGHQRSRSHSPMKKIFRTITIGEESEDCVQESTYLPSHKSPTRKSIGNISLTPKTPRSSFGLSYRPSLSSLKQTQQKDNEQFELNMDLVKSIQNSPKKKNSHKKLKSITDSIHCLNDQLEENDSSLISGGSIPDEWCGNYDREKWQAIKMWKMDQGETVA